VCELALEGFIDASNFSRFERALQQVTQSGCRYLILDFTEVHYINSTGISSLIRYFEELRARGGMLCLANVARPVGLSMHLLGVTSLFPFLTDMDAARELVRQHAGEASGQPPALERPAQAGTGKASRIVPLRRRKLPGLEKARVLVITPAKGRFTRVLRLRFRGLNGDYHLLHDPREALERYDELAPDLVVVDDRVDPKGELVNRLKVQGERSLTSVIKMYPRETDVLSQLDFKIWENDYLVEPFELLELFSLTEAELCRVPKDKKVFHQQVHFEFRTTQENVDKAYKLADLVLRQSIAIQEDATALYAAVKEGIDNAVIHGNRWDREKTVDVNFLVDHKKVTVLVEDQGEGFDYEYYLARLDDKEAFEKAKRRIMEENARGGLGILLMSKCSDRLEYSGSGNLLRLEKNLP
jgi:serine/threonine-protein kinase RsbW